MKIICTANSPKGVSGFPIFTPGEIREVSKEEGEKLVLCPFLEEYIAPLEGDMEKVQKSTKKK